MQPSKLKSSRKLENRDWAANLGGAALCVTAIALMTGYSSYKASHARKPPLVIVLMDLHQSRVARKRECGQFRTTLDLFPVGSDVRILTFDTNAVTRYRGVPTSDNDLGPVEDFLMTAKPEGLHTVPSVALSQITPDIERAARDGQDCYVVINTDGDDSNPTETRRKATRLAGAPNLKAVWIPAIALQGNQRNIVQKAYAPLGDRLVVSGPIDQRAGFDRFRTLANSSVSTHEKEVGK